MDRSGGGAVDDRLEHRDRAPRLGCRQAQADARRRRHQDGQPPDGPPRPSHWRLHDLRHWSATEAIGRGHDIRTVAGRLGHANPAMTLRTYAHALDGADAGVAATLAVALDGEA